MKNHPLPIDQPNEAHSSSLISNTASSFTNLSQLIIAKQLSRAPKELLSIKNLLKTEPKTGQYPLRLIISSGQLKEIPTKFLTREVLLHNFPDCPLFNCAHYNCLNLIPKEILNCSKILNLKDPLGNSLLHIAAETKQLHLFNPESLTQERMISPNKEKWTPLHHSANSQCLEQVPAHLKTKSNMCLQSANGLTPLHSIFIHTQKNTGITTKEINTNILDKENIWLRNMHGMTIAHIGAKFGTLKHIAEALLSPELLESPDNDKNSVYHTAAKNGNLNQIPKKLLTKGGLKLRNINGETPIHMAAQSGTLNHIPAPIISSKNLLSTNIFGENCFELASNQTQKILDKLIKSLNYRTLAECYKQIEDKPIKSLIKKELRARLIKKIRKEFDKDQPTSKNFDEIF
jgi:ankyrin repeat protein